MKDKKKNFHIIKLLFVILFNYCSIIIYLKKNKKKDKISIIIPTYNRENLILRSLESILKQTYTNIEVIIIDDCSKDNTKNIIKNLNDNRIRYRRLKKNKGASFARNFGIKISTGKYISFQDSDDLYHLNKLEKQYNNLIKHKSDFDFCKICVNLVNKSKYIFPNNNQEKNIIKKKIVYELCNGNFISTQSILVKKAKIEKYLFDTTFPRLQDYDLVLRMLPNVKISYTNKVLVDLFRQNDSISNSSQKYREAMRLLFNKNYKINCDNKTKYYNHFKKNKKLLSKKK